MLTTARAAARVSASPDRSVAKLLEKLYIVRNVGGPSQNIVILPRRNERDVEDVPEELSMGGKARLCGRLQPKTFTEWHIHQKARW
jgi:hypothetical protein